MPNYNSLFVVAAAIGATLATGCSEPPAPLTPVAACPTPTAGPTLHVDPVTDEVWTAAQSPHVIQTDLSIATRVTLEPCAQVLIAPRVTVTVRLKGSFVGEGSETRPLFIGARDAGRPWSRIAVVGGSVRLSHAVIEEGGDPQNTLPYLQGMLSGQPGSDPLAVQESFSLQNVQLRGSKSNGIVLDGARFSDDSANLRVTGSAAYPVSIHPRAVGSLPVGTYLGNALDEILLPGRGLVEDIVQDTVMRDRGVPYHVGHPDSAAQLRVGTQLGAPVATLTIEPGVVVRFAKNGIFEIEHFTGATAASGALIARGTAAKPIVFTSAEPAAAPGDWNGLVFGGIPDPRNLLEYIEVRYAGREGTPNFSCAPGQGRAAVSILGQPAGVFISHSRISASAGHGISRGWIGAALDFAATNSFTNVPGCLLTNPQPPPGGCAGVAPCGP